MVGSCLFLVPTSFLCRCNFHSWGFDVIFATSLVQTDLQTRVLCSLDKGYRPWGVERFVFSFAFTFALAFLARLASNSVVYPPFSTILTAVSRTCRSTILSFFHSPVSQLFSRFLLVCHPLLHGFHHQRCFRTGQCRLLHRIEQAFRQSRDLQCRNFGFVH